MFTKYFVRVTVKPKGSNAYSVRHIYEGASAYDDCLRLVSSLNTDTCSVLDVSISACNIYSASY